jgi:hypothetical protein
MPQPRSASDGSSSVLTFAQQLQTLTVRELASLVDMLRNAKMDFYFYKLPDDDTWTTWRELYALHNEVRSVFLAKFIQST